MSFPIPGDAIEQNLDLNQLVIKNSAATFFMRVDGTQSTSDDIQPGDILAVDRSLNAKDGSLVVAALNGELSVLRVKAMNNQIRPRDTHDNDDDSQFEVWGLVTTIIRSL